MENKNINVYNKEKMLLIAISALYSYIYPEIRRIALAYDQKNNKIILRIYIDRPITEFDREVIGNIEFDFDFPQYFDPYFDSKCIYTRGKVIKPEFDFLKWIYVRMEKDQYQFYEKGKIEVKKIKKPNKELTNEEKYKIYISKWFKSSVESLLGLPYPELRKVAIALYNSDNNKVSVRFYIDREVTLFDQNVLHEFVNRFSEKLNLDVEFDYKCVYAKERIVKYNFSSKYIGLIYSRMEKDDYWLYKEE